MTYNISIFRPCSDEEAIRIVREYFPDASVDQAGYILWNNTGWPCFWKTCDWEFCMREQLAELKAQHSY